MRQQCDLVVVIPMLVLLNFQHEDVVLQVYICTVVTVDHRGDFLNSTVVHQYPVSASTITFCFRTPADNMILMVSWGMQYPE